MRRRAGTPGLSGGIQNICLIFGVSVLLWSISFGESSRQGLLAPIHGYARRLDVWTRWICCSFGVCTRRLTQLPVYCCTSSEINGEIGRCPWRSVRMHSKRRKQQATASRNARLLLSLDVARRVMYKINKVHMFRRVWHPINQRPAKKTRSISTLPNRGQPDTSTEIVSRTQRPINHNIPCTRHTLGSFPHVPVVLFLRSSSR